MGYYIGVDGGGTRTTVGIAGEDGREILRQVGPPGLIDPLRPTAMAEWLVALVREAASAAGALGAVKGLCAGLAGVGHETEREIVETAFARSGIAQRALILTDGEIAHHAAFGARPGVLLISGTGSGAYGRGEDGRYERCGGWGMRVGDEGSGYEIGRAALEAALHAVDGRAPASRLLPVLLEVLELPAPEAIPRWVGRAQKAEVALLTLQVIRLSEEGDLAARAIVAQAVLDLAAHVEALVRRLGPWSHPPNVALHGGVARQPAIASALAALLQSRSPGVRIVESAPDAVIGALAIARALT